LSHYYCSYHNQFTWIAFMFAYIGRCPVQTLPQEKKKIKQ
jgi:hypothetical protein